MTITLPAFVSQILTMLHAAGFEAYVVGGCVRDILLGKSPSDWDVCTSALPHETQSVFTGFKTIPTGIKHGTVTIISNGHHVEVTTLRIDGEYSDNRRPDTVTFTPNLKDDLARRDFTINAMAYCPDIGIIDPFGGRMDLRAKTIRCVGVAEKRFREDALRIMRALRFAAVYGFAIEPQTAKALGDCKHLLDEIAAERIAVELNKLMVSEHCTKILRQYSHIIEQILPEITPAIGFTQSNPHHIYDVWEHTLCAIENSPANLCVRLALLFHDLGKPLCATPHEGGFTYFPNHPELSCRIAVQALRRLKYDNKTRHTVKLLVAMHDSHIVPEKTSVKKLLREIGPENMHILLDVKLADNQAKSPQHRRHYQETLYIKKLFDEILAADECFSLKTLAVSGNDLMEAYNISGTEVGDALDYLLNLVIEEKCENEKKALMRAFDEYTSRGV